MLVVLRILPVGTEVLRAIASTLILHAGMRLHNAAVQRALLVVRLWHASRPRILFTGQGFLRYTHRNAVRVGIPGA